MLGMGLGVTMAEGKNIGSDFDFSLSGSTRNPTRDPGSLTRSHS